MELPVRRILLKKVNELTFKSMHGSAAPGGGGGGSTDIRFGTTAAQAFFGTTEPWIKQVHAQTIEGVLEEDLIQELEAAMNAARGNEWRIKQQYRNRHIAWSTRASFPVYGATTPIPRIILWLAETNNDEYWAGYLTEDRENTLPPSLLEISNSLTDNNSTKTITFGESINMSNVTLQAIKALKKDPCILFYGPPGTGKTVAMQELKAFISDPTNFLTMCLDTEDPDRPFFEREITENSFNDPKIWWLTFHQSMSYEDFILGLRPVSNGGSGIDLKHRAGPMLEAMEHANAGGTSFIFIDELNRGNVSKIFGEFITFMEFDKRKKEDGSIDAIKSIPLTFPALNKDAANDHSELIDFSDGRERTIAYPYYVPRNLYIIASMNSLDRSVAPLDSALSRRFSKINVPTDYEALKQHILSNGSEEQASIIINILLKINDQLLCDFGEDFQLGQSYFWQSFGDNIDDFFVALTASWHDKALPQLMELYRNRHSDLSALLIPDTSSHPWPYELVTLNGTDILKKRNLEAQHFGHFFRILANVPEAAEEAPIEPAE